MKFNYVNYLFLHLGHPPSGDFFALGSKPLSGRQSSPNPTPPAKKPHLDDEEGGTLFSDPIRISQVIEFILSCDYCVIITNSILRQE